MNLELLLPELFLLGFAIVIVIIDLFTDRKALLVVVSLIGLAVSAGLTIAMWGSVAQFTFNNMLAIDNFSIFFKLMFLGIASIVILSSVDYTPKIARFRSEFHVLVLLSTLGMMIMAAATELITLFVALELTSISLYALVGLLKNDKSSEASLKYLLLGAVASAVMLYGMALIFGLTGRTHFIEIAQAISASTALQSIYPPIFAPALILGIVLMVAGFGFKIAAVPFHMWVPDVYEGAPTPITAFLSVASKAAGFAVILRVFYSAFGSSVELSMDWGLLFAVLAVLGMFIGNLTAIPQTNIKRMLGYSSIAQAGYLLVGVATMGVAVANADVGQSVVIFFLISYAFTNLGAFAAIIAISNKINSDLIKDFSGMGKRAPLMALALTLCMISLIGMPPAAGFIAKFYIFSTAVNHGLLWLVIIAVLNSVISAYYYLRVVKVMWLGDPASEEKVPSSTALRLALSISCLGVLILGVIPGFGMRLAEFAARLL